MKAFFDNTSYKGTKEEAMANGVIIYAACILAEAIRNESEEVDFKVIEPGGPKEA